MRKLRKVNNFDLKPKFQGWTKQDYLSANIPFISPQTCKEFTSKYLTKYPGLWLANCKYDGFRTICIVTDEGNRFFSRRLSKKTDWMAENTDNVPHLRDKKGLPVGTILDGEFIHPLGFSVMQSAVGSLPEKGIEFQQKNGWIEYHVFDILQLGEDNYENMDYIFRASMLQKYNIFNDVPIYVEGDEKLVEELNSYRGLKVHAVNSFNELRDRMWEEGKEGIILKRASSKYYVGKRSAEWLKIKETATENFIITGFQEPTKNYDGKTLEEKGYWDYWEDSHGKVICARKSIKEAQELIPITKPYAMGWIGAFIFGLLRDGIVVNIGEAKGISDADQEYVLKNREELIGTVIEVKYQSIINTSTKSLRHPRFYRFLPNIDSDTCVWENL